MSFENVSNCKTKALDVLVRISFHLLLLKESEIPEKFEPRLLPREIDAQKRRRNYEITAHYSTKSVAGSKMAELFLII